MPELFALSYIIGKSQHVLFHCQIVLKGDNEIDLETHVFYSIINEMCI